MASLYLKSLHIIIWSLTKFWRLLDSSDDYDEAVTTLLHLLDTFVAVMILMKLSIQVLYQKESKKK